jgi:PIN domain nuclease of toxin-antitoxin system
MPLLLDSHVFLWYAIDAPQLSRKSFDAISTHTEVHVSVATVWELGIKHSLGRLDVHGVTFPEMIAHCLERCQASLLPITPAHVETLTLLPHLHRDPFDRMLVAQAKTERLTLVSHDQQVARYDCEVIW